MNRASGRPKRDHGVAETSRLARMQQLLGDRMGREVLFISISIDPEHDTPAVLKAYATKFNAGPGWIFLTGKMTDIDLLSRKLGLWSDPTETEDYTEAPTAVKRGDGEYLYRSLCAGCHTLGQGDKVGPDLVRALETHDRAWLLEYTLRPDVVRAKKDPIAMMLASRYREVRMPNLGLTAADVQSILGYIDTLRVRGTASRHAAPQTPASPRATAARSGPHRSTRRSRCHRRTEESFEIVGDVMQIRQPGGQTQRRSHYHPAR